MKTPIKVIVVICAATCCMSFTANASTRLIKPKIEREYDSLQKIFIDIDADTTEDDLLELIEDNDLEYTVESYMESRGYKIAFEHDAAKQKYATPGDHLEVSFNKDDGSLMYADYTKKMSLTISLYYVYGSYWDFREKEPDNEYTGYYFYTAGKNEDGITIQYDNGCSTETGFHPVDSAEDAL